MNKNSTPVYSTGQGKICPDCHLPVDSCICSRQKKVYPQASFISIKKDVKGRRGKTVTMITGLGGTQDELETAASHIKQSIGCGGSVKDGAILIQGDHRKKIAAYFNKQGLSAKITG